MPTAIFDGVVENGSIKLDASAVLAEHARVFVVVPEAATASMLKVPRALHIRTPRLAHPEDVERLKKSVRKLQKP